MQVDGYTTLRRRHDAGVLAYFLRRTGSAELAWDLAAETWAAAELNLARRRPPEPPPPAWLFAIARDTLCAGVAHGRIPDRARRKLGREGAEAPDARLCDAATEASLAELVAGLQPALRQAVLAPVPPEHAAQIAVRLRARPASRLGPRPARRRLPGRSRLRLAAR